MRLRRAVLILTTSASLAVSAAACGGRAARPGSSATAPTGKTTTDGVRTGAGGSGQHATGSFSLAFARCMRAHGVPDFPDPDGQPGQLGPSSGIDPASPKFRAASTGPCKSLAPPGWVGSGKVTRPANG